MGDSPLDRELTICDMNCFLWRVGDAIYCGRCSPGAVALPALDPDGGMARVDRTNCCAGWPDPCGYHEGWIDGWDAAIDAIKGERGVDWELEDR